jgi:outer membrane protein OmpA-like peptidoglycan-associated protein
MRAKPVRRAALLALATGLGACSGGKLTSTLPPPAAPASYVGASAGLLAPAAVEPELAALEKELGALAGRRVAVPLELSREGATLKLSFGAQESFAPGSAQLEPAALAAYAGLARALAARPGTVAHIRVTGDAGAASEPESALAARRATSLQAYLAMRGVPGTRLRANGAEGAGTVEVLIKPIVAGNEAEAWVPPS